MDNPSPSKKLTRQQAYNILIAFVTALLLLGQTLGWFAPDGDEPTARGITNFNSVTLSGDLEVGDDATITGDLDVAGAPTFGSGNLAPLLSADTSEVLFAAERTITGTATITEATHGVSDITAAFCTMGQTPSTSAGAAALCWIDFGATGNLTITIEQDDWVTNATSGAVIDYVVVGTP